MTTSGIVRRVRLGDEVQTYCGRCKEERTHQAVALNSQGGVERVICRTCQGNHLYRDRHASVKKETTEKAARTPTTRTPRRRADTPPTFSDAPRHPYSPRESFTKGQLILHTKFGVGEVVEVRAGKIDVRFTDELRTLLHAG